MDSIDRGVTSLVNSVPFRSIGLCVSIAGIALQVYDADYNGLIVLHGFNFLLSYAWLVRRVK